MNPQDFCAERRYDFACLLTYSFDPLFFEKVPLRALWSGGTGEILVIGDRGELDAGVARADGHLMHLGRSYRLAQAEVPGHQHAKIILRVGDEGALIWVGSGNLTYGGWGSNVELATAWSIEASDADGAGLVKNLILELERLVGGGAAALLGRARDRGWIASADDAADIRPRVVVSGVTSTLADRTAARWGGRRFDRLLIRTGSTDRKGRFIRWAAETFGVREAVVCMDPRHCAFDPDALSALPCRVTLVPVEGSRHPHAKLCYFQGPDGDAAMMGSANCSAAAWLVTGADGGNVEAMVFYDDCTKKEFKNSLAPFKTGEDRPLTEIPDLGARIDPEQQRTKNTGPKLVQLSASLSQGYIRAQLEERTPEAAAAELDVAGSRVRMTPDPHGVFWTGSWNGPPPQPGTLFGRLVIRSGDDEQFSNVRWIDDEDELLHSTRGRRIADPIRRLGSAATSSEQRRILQDLAWISQHLLEGQSSFPDPGRRTGSGESKKDGEAEPVDPDALVRSLSEVDPRHQAQGHHGGGPGLPIFGVMHALFPEDHEPWSEQDDQEEDDSEGGAKKRSEPPTSEPTRVPPPPETLQKRLRTQLKKYLAQIPKEDFWANCTATQLTQAVSYPLAVAAFGVRRGWIDSATAADWVVQVCDFLFRLPTGKPAHTGLLDAVHERFRENGDEELFHAVVGDGTLWVALIAGLGAVPWDGPFAYLDRALSLSDVFEEQRLVSVTTPGRLRDLLSRLKIRDSNADVLVEARRARDLTRQLENRLRTGEASFRSTQANRDHLEGDALYHPKARFARALEDGKIQKSHKLKIYLRSRASEMKVIGDFYVNVRLAAESDAEVGRVLAEMK